ncbi:SRPBCC domain-containing protein [Oscillatoria sp. CS-180]|uniref:SRPBCC domain-containing protein n=1 Tax=Oscillatoria sp. CS-180 TaxID=3021720 RepID=UPI00232CDC9A|nr:SRPBCC domain-containing protein [Oscillatoria sp. CS-180]MDB9529466.1 SRPBCC domain-containing protein [Oscillatoria sp. CS-180]
MPTLRTEIEINAPRSVVWEALIRKDEWRRWNTFLFDGDPALRICQGQEIFLSVRRLEDDEFTDIEPLITLVQPQVCLRWVARTPGFRSESSFELQDLSPTRTLYSHQERFKGILSNVFLPFIRQDEKQGIKRMTRQLKRYVERREYRQYRKEKRDRQYRSSL